MTYPRLRKGVNERGELPNLNRLDEWMTIGIGVLASSDESHVADTAILVCDTKSSYESAYSASRAPKLFQFQDFNLYAIGAGRIDRAAELCSLFPHFLKETANKGTYENHCVSITRAVDKYRREFFRLRSITKCGRQSMSLPADFDEGHLSPELLQLWKELDIGVDVIVATVEDSGTAHLFLLGGNGDVEPHGDTGYCAIGSGNRNALFWLSYRNHNFGVSPFHAAYHAFEAKAMAETSPYVDQRIVMICVQKGVMHFITKPNNPDPVPFTLDNLRTAFATYGPRPTRILTPWLGP